MVQQACSKSKEKKNAFCLIENISMETFFFFFLISDTAKKVV